jgi:hypothetical protein
LVVYALKPKIQKQQKIGEKNLGFNTNDYHYAFWWKGKKAKDCSTQWSPLVEDTAYDEPSKKNHV